MSLALPSPIVLALPSMLAPLVRVTRLTVELAPDPRLDNDPALAARIRGAFGHRLAAMARTGGEALLAWKVLFSEKVEPIQRGHAPAPFVIAADLLPGRRLAATLSLFGLADRWRDPVFDAFVAALSAAPGLTLTSPGKRSAPSLRVPLSVVSIRWTRKEGADIPASSNRVRLCFATPVQFGQEGSLSENQAQIVVGLAERISMLAPIFGCRYETSLSDWRDRARKICFDASRFKPIRFSLWSSGGGRRMRYGWTGDLVVADADRELLALLAIGEHTGCGRDAAKGFGRYHLFPEP
jgi:hypothetical protein